jgi:hypothetical protein
MNVSVRKAVALVLALAKLHNYCIDPYDCVVLPSTAPDAWEMEVNGAVTLVKVDGSDVAIQQLIDGGNHFDDIGYHRRHNRQLRYNYMSENEGQPLPRDQLHSMVASAGLTRPALIRW